MPLFFILLFLALAAYGQQQRLAVINTLDDGEPPIKLLELIYLTDKLRETASNVLPKSHYGVMTTESIVAFLGSEERAIKVCRESSCLAELGRMVSADYVSQARIGRFGNDLTIKTELYEVKSGTLVGSFTGYSKDIYGLLTLIDEKAPDLFKRLLNAPSGSSTPPPAVVFAAPQEEIVPTEYEPYEPPVADMAAANRKRLDKQPSLLSLDLPDWLQLGLRAGINYGHGNGIQLGLVLDIPMKKMLYIQPGLMYIQKHLRKSEDNSDNDYDSYYEAHYLELPFLISLKASAFRLGTGPYFAIPINSDVGFDYGLSVGIGFDIRMFYIGGFIDLNFIKTLGTLGLNVGVNL